MTDIIDRWPARAEGWLRAAVDLVGDRPDAVDEVFPLAGRHCGRGTLADGRRIDDTARLALLTALPLRGRPLLDVLWRLYRRGDAGERRAVLVALPSLVDRLADAAVPIVLDALRTNDTRLITAAMNGYATRYLAPEAYRQAVVKCVFVGVPLDRIDGLRQRGDAELGRMLVRYAEEREAAGRDVAPDVTAIIRELA
jgi:hypothetical protein